MPVPIAVAPMLISRRNAATSRSRSRSSEIVTDLRSWRLAGVAFREQDLE
jgi:hypothetical protein